MLKGAAVFYADLVRCCTIPVELDFIAVSSYGQGSSPGELSFRLDVTESMRPRDGYRLWYSIVIVKLNVMESAGHAQ